MSTHKSAKEEALDQLGHAVAGFLIVSASMLVIYAICFVFNDFKDPDFSSAGKMICLLLSTIVSMCIAWDRKMDQHPGQCGSGCKLDLSVWFGGSLISDIIIFNIV